MMLEIHYDNSKLVQGNHHPIFYDRKVYAILLYQVSLTILDSDYI